MPLPRPVVRRPAALVVRACAAAALVVAFAVGGGVVASASAGLPLHARLMSSTPGDGSRVGTATEVVLAFSEEINPSFVAVTVTGPGGDEAEGGPQAEGRTVTQALSPALAAGEHVTTFRVVSADGHPVSGTVTFTTTGGPATDQPSASAPASSAPAGPTALTTPSQPDAGSSAGSDEPASTEDSTSTPWAVAGVGAVLLAALAAGLWRSRRASPREPEPDGTQGP